MFGVFTIVITFKQQKIARQQWLADRNESRLQREQELKIAYEERAVQSHINQERYRDELLVVYTKEIGDLLKENNGSLISNPLTHILARAKTLNAIKQLDGLRQPLIIRFLYEAKQLSLVDVHLLNFSYAQLLDIDFAHAFFYNSLWRSNVEYAKIANTIFTKFNCIEVNFAHANLKSSSFRNAFLQKADFSGANLP